jgi:tetratricopeptide (TPR) repeat protein
MDKLVTVFMKNLFSMILVFLLIGISHVDSSSVELEDAQEKVRQNPDNAFAHFNLGFSYNSLGRYQEAIAPLKEAIRLEPDNSVLHERLGFSYNSLGRYHEAIAPLKEAIRLKPDNFVAYGRLGFSLNSLGRYQEAIAPFKEVILINPNDSYAHFNLGFSYSSLGLYQEAIASYKEAIRLKPDNFSAHSGIGFTYENLGQFQEAIASYKEAARLKPDNIFVHNNLGRTYSSLGREQEAIASYEKAVALFREEIQKKPKESNLHTGLGFNLSNLGRYQEAIASYKEAIRLKPDNFSAHSGIGVTYENLGQSQEAIASYKEAIRLKPDDLDAKIGLGSAFLIQGKLNTAFTNLKEADQIKPNDPEILSFLGMIYWEFDKPKKSMEVLEQAIANMEATHWSASHIYASLSETYEKLKRYDDAIDMAKKALESNYDEPFANFILGLSYDAKLDGLSAISHMRVAAKGFQESKDPYDRQGRWAIRNAQKYRAKSKKKLREFYSKYDYSPEDFGDTEIATAPSISLPADPELPEAQQLVSGGTGFLFSSRDYIITNYHVVKGASSIEVKFPDGEIIKASVQAKDSQNDIAVLKLSQSPSTPIPDLKFGDSSKVRPGDKVFTIGYPASAILGKNQKITDGIISSVTGIEDDPTMFQITVPIQPGNSGGPLFNEQGEVIGITTASLSLNAIQSLGAVPQNVNYAIKSSFVNNLLTTIPKTLLSNRGIVVVPNKPGNSLSDFFERVSNNIVLIEAK